MMELKWVWFLRISVMSVLLVLGDACLEHERIALLQLKPFFNHYNELADWDESLYLRGNAIAGCIQNEGFEKLSSVLKNRPEASNHPNGFQWFSRLGNLETLDLSGNEHLLHIQELNNLTKLRYLDLNNNNGIESISNQDGKQLKLINLEQLDLRLNYLTNLKHLDLSSNRIESISTQGLPSLKSLSMASNDLQGSLDVKELINLTNLKKLDLSNNHIESLQSSEDDGKKLQHLSRLEELNLDGNLLNNSVFASLNGFSNLKSLHISGNQLKGSLDLDAFSSLRELYVRGNQLRDFVSHKGLCGLKNLEVLDVWGVDTSSTYRHDLVRLRTVIRHISPHNGRSSRKSGAPTDACLEHERIALLQLKPFFNHYNELVDWDESLYLQGNAIAGCIENEGFAKLSVLRKLLHIQGLNNLTNLIYLDLNSNKIESISNQDGTQLRLTKLEQLDLSGNLFRDNTFSFLEGLPSLKSLDMSTNDLHGSLDIKKMSNLTSLKKLNLNFNQIESLQSSKDDGTKLQKLTQLEELNLNGNLLNNSVFASLHGFSNLKSLDISHNQLQGSLDMKDFDAFTSLRELYISNNQLKDFVIQKGGCDLKNLEVWDLSWNAFEGMLPHCLVNLTSLPNHLQEQDSRTRDTFRRR
ncbi:hypothetical protein V6N13_047335 [Hibiscus sabdariffa]